MTGNAPSNPKPFPLAPWEPNMTKVQQMLDRVGFQ